jgi:hypothetical protein
MALLACLSREVGTAPTGAPEVRRAPACFYSRVAYVVGPFAQASDQARSRDAIKAALSFLCVHTDTGVMFASLRPLVRSVS